jgi:hypothetical protein
MKLLRPSSLRLSRRVRRFNASLIATLAAMALAACGGEPAAVMPASSIAKGVQQILQPGGRPALLSSQPQTPTGRQS